MKKDRSYKKRPEGIEEKQPRVKDPLLQTYFTSLLSLILCVTMFFGTSYAWFTSEVNNTANEIYIGTLDVELQKQIIENEEKKYVSLSGKDIEGNHTQNLFDSNIRWEPGYTALETIRVVNEGDLAFKYVLSFTDGSLAEGSVGNLENVAKNFDVWVYDHDTGDGAPSPASYADIADEDTKWEYVGTLAELLAGKSVLEGAMEAVRDEITEAPANTGTTDDVATTDTYTIAIHMKENKVNTTGENGANLLMGQKISLNVKLVAYQMASEQDGFNNPDYDSNVTAVSDAKNLQSALSSGGDVQLTANVKIEDIEDRAFMNGGVLYGNGKTISYSGTRNTNGSSVGVVTTSGGIVDNLTISGGDNGRAMYITELTSDLYVSDCTLSGAYAFNLNSSTETGYTINFTDTVFESWTSYANVMACANFTDCTFGDVLKPYGDTTLTNCTFTTEGLDVSALEDDESITLINCTYMEKIIESAILTATTGDGGNVTVKCYNSDYSENNLLTISEGMVKIKQ